VFVLLPTAAWAQEEPAPSPSAKPAEKPIAGEILPETYYLKDKEGKLQAVLGFPYEQFIEIYKLKNQLDEQNKQPDFSIQSFTLSGSVAGGRAELTADVSVVVHADGWVRVPLRLGDAVLRETAAFEGPGDHFVHLDPGGDGYLGWIRSEPEKTHRITLRLWAPVAQIGSESHLHLTSPQATVSRLQLQVPIEKAVVRVSDSAALESVKPAGAGKSTVSAAGISGEFDLTWLASDNQVARLPIVLESSAAMTVRVDGRSINSDAKLTVRSSGGEFDRFQVRLPPDAEYVATPQTGITLVAVEAETPGGKVYDVKLAKKTAGPVDVRIVAQRTYPAQRAEEGIELAGFEVLGAARQWGTVAVQVEGNWQIKWGELRHVRQVDEVAATVRRDDLAAGFEYSVQPYSLVAHILPQTTRVRAEGDYVIQVASEEALLRGRIKYQIRGAKIRSLEVDLPGWEVDVVGPANLVNVDAVSAEPNRPLVIPLLQATSGELELTIEARQKIDAETAKVALRLPTPHGESVPPANVTVLSADNVELLIEPDATNGLVAQPVRPKGSTPTERQQEPLYLRTAGDEPTFVASIKVHEQTISSATDAQLEIDDREARVDERINFEIGFVPTDSLLLGVPRLLRVEELSIWLDGQRLSQSAIRQRSDEGNGDVTMVRLALPTPRIGRVELQVRYAVRHEKLATAANTLIGVPLVMPGEGKLSANELSIVPESGVTVTYPRGAWTENTRTTRAAAAGTLQLSAASAIPQVTLAVSFKEAHGDQVVSIEQCWLQTRLTDSRRQDRAVFRLTTSAPNLRIALPEGAELASLELAVDGRRVKPEFGAQAAARDVVVPLAGGSGQRVLDIRYHFTARQPVGDVQFAAPEIKPAAWIQQLYWQVILPPHEHVLGAPPDFACEHRWVFSDLFWRRRALLDERALESWIGVDAETDGQRLVGESAEDFRARTSRQAQATNRYLYSTVGAAAPLALHTISRARLVLWASLPLLACGLILIYLPAARHPATLLVVAAIVAAGTLIDPESALLVAQAASLGLVLAALAWILARVSLRPAPATVPIRGSSRAMERPFTEIYQRAPSSGSQPSTSTNPLVPASAPEVQS